MNPQTRTLQRELLAPVRALVPALLGRLDDPHAELLALVWGPRFDRQHARGLIAHQASAAPALLHSVMSLADRFDHLPGVQQQRLRQLILRHHRRWDNGACPASC